MCGIAGILTPDLAPVPESHIASMTSTLVHRGPDGHGYHHEPGIAFGHRRLNIIDIDGGAQPMSNEDGTVWVTFNGEVYNFVDLMPELIRRGHRFHSRCDTEVLVHGYEEWGDALVDRLEGMFAFAIWDNTRKRALIARDRMGKKPLFYAHLPDGRLLFGSEAKSLVAHPDLRPAIDEEGLAAYLTYEYLPAPLSLFAGVKKLPAGHLLTYERGRVSVRRYWDLPFEGSFQGSFGDAVARFRELFLASVKRRLISDVPLGVFLSGGIDSSSVAAAVVHHRPPEQVRTFSIGFDDESFDESSYARQVAKHLGTQHHEHTFSAGAMLDTLPRVIDKLDEPFGDASLLPTYLLSAFTRRHVTVALGGDGGDELLLGYPTFKAEAAAQVYSRLPESVRRVAARHANGLPVDIRNFSFDFIVKSFMRAADAPEDVRHPLWLGSFLPGSADDPLKLDLRRQFPAAHVLEPARTAYLEAPDARRLQRLSYQYCKTYLAEDILVKVDRASMAVSLEVRAPFLDAALVELMTSLPPRYKLYANESKRVLKAAFKADLPRDVLYRKKKGFGIPVARWLRGPLRERMLDLLAPARIKQRGLLRSEVVTRLVEEHLRERRDNRKPLWTLLMLEIWRDRYGV